MLPLLVLVIILAIVLWIAQAVLEGFSAPPWLFKVLIGVGLIILVILVAQAFGVATPALR